LAGTRRQAAEKVVYSRTLPGASENAIRVISDRLAHEELLDSSIA